MVGGGEVPRDSMLGRFSVQSGQQKPAGPSRYTELGAEAKSRCFPQCVLCSGVAFFFAGILAHTSGLEVVIVPVAASVDEELARAVFLVIPPTTEVGHAVARVFWQAAYVLLGV